MRATVLIDNISKNDLKSEWGLSVYIEHDGHKILLDGGTTGVFVQNAKDLEMDLSDVDIATLSHAHYDHADGLPTFLDEYSKAKLYLRDTTQENCYRKLFLWKSKYIGVKKGMLSKYADRIVYASGDYEIAKDIYLIPHKTPNLSQIGRKGKMYVIRDGKMVPDDFRHEQSLVIRTEKGLCIFNSCSHGGADNIINEIKSTFPDEKIYAIVGGFHLFLSSEKDIRALAAGIRSTGIEKVYTGHCTGQRAFDILKNELGDSVTQLYTGIVIE